MLRPARSLLALSVSLLTSSALAQDAGDMAAARQLGVEGVKLADAGKCDLAVDRLTRAEKLFHAPTTLARLGECQVALGRLVEGTENLRRVVREVLPAGAPPAFVAAQDRARGVLDKAAPRIARLKIVVNGAGDAVVTVKVDDQTVSSALLGVDRPTDPGEHEVVASAPGFVAARSKVTLKDGGGEVVTLSLVPDPNAVKPPVAEGSTPTRGDAATNGSDLRAPPVTPPPSTKKNYVPAIVVLGAGGAGLVVGAVFGGLALGERGSLADACGANRVCPASAQPTYDRATTFSTVSTIGFVAGGVLAAASVVLFLFAPTKSVETAAFVPVVGPGTIGAIGRF
jgi:hypothetical protein